MVIVRRHLRRVPYTRRRIRVSQHRRRPPVSQRRRSFWKKW